MRERLVAAFITLTAVVIVVFSIARAYSISGLVEDHETEKAKRTVVLVSAVLREREENNEPITSLYLTQFLDADRIEYRRSDVPTVDASAVGFAEGPGDITRSRQVHGGGVITVVRSGQHVQDLVAGALLQLVLMGLGLVLVAAAVGWFLARTLARPFRRLARIADDFGLGRFDADIPHFAVPEAEEIGQAMRVAGEELRGLVARERQFAANASHQLRTPITALRLNLEDLSLWPETHPLVGEELGRALSELDRLTEAVTDLLALSRGHQLSEAVQLNLTDLVADTVSRWQPQAKLRMREIVLAETGPLPIQLAPGPIAQVLDVLLENALTHGEGTISVYAGGSGGYLRVLVADGGERTIGNDVFRRGESRLRREGTQGDGIGLAVATEIAEALGGRLRLEPNRKTTFSLLLPKPRDAPSERRA